MSHDFVFNYVHHVPLLNVYILWIVKMIFI